jgi:hypothetical protein
MCPEDLTRELFPVLPVAGPLLWIKSQFSFQYYSSATPINAFPPFCSDRPALTIQILFPIQLWSNQFKISRTCPGQKIVTSSRFSGGYTPTYVKRRSSCIFRIHTSSTFLRFANPSSST